MAAVLLVEANIRAVVEAAVGRAAGQVGNHIQKVRGHQVIVAKRCEDKQHQILKDKTREAADLNYRILIKQKSCVCTLHTYVSNNFRVDTTLHCCWLSEWKEPPVLRAKVSVFHYNLA